ncbi:MAG: ABC transporter ATP-binding protein [Neisseriales bacterium]|nr:MAG: ABC transporter ATP-binding protein [Neisseriales bacterium]
MTLSSTQSVFKANQISVKYQRQDILDKLNINLIDGKITAILGPNGSGKSTLLKALSGLIPCHSGKVMINDKSLSHINRTDLAKLLSILPQSPEAPTDITVNQLVSYGRYAYSSWFNKNKKEDNKQVKWALAVTNLTELAESFLHELSGGERQRVWIAMSLAQNSDYLFLDEPTTYLDIRFQFEIMQLVKNLNQQQGKTIVMVLHEIQHALNYADYILLLNQGKIHSYAPVEEIIHSGAIEEVFKIRIKQFTENAENHFIICNNG